MPDQGDRARMRRIIMRMRSFNIVVREMPGHENRGATWPRVPLGVLDHHDASTIKSGEWGSLGMIIAGRSDVPGPLSQFQVARCLDGVPKVAVIADGIANHAGLGGPLRLPNGRIIPANSGNSHLYGAEKANNGVDEPYTEAADYAADGLFLAIVIECDVDWRFVYGHKEWAPTRKIDPRYDMNRQRESVRLFKIRSKSPPTPPQPPKKAEGFDKMITVVTCLEPNRAGFVLGERFIDLTNDAIGREFAQRAIGSQMAVEIRVNGNTWNQITGATET
jgi:hypothetical protein